MKFTLLVGLVPVAAFAAGGDLPLQPRNDSGQIICFGLSGEEVPCNLPGLPSLDGRYGRDVAAADGVLPKIGGGHGGFDFTKLSNDGGELPPEAELGPEPHEWACTRDNLTGLTWEIKILDPASPRHYEWSFHWFSEDADHNGGNPGEAGGFEPACGFTLECNTQAFIDYLNGLNLCGRSDWRLPSLEELQGIVNYGSSFFQGGAMDRVYFADGGGYSGFGGGWTGDTSFEPSPGEAAYAVNFDDGHAEPHPKGGLQPIRLVAGDAGETVGEDPACGDMENLQIRPSTAGAYLIDGRLVTDRRTGLVWDRCTMGQELIGEGPDAFCEGQPPGFEWQQAMQEVEQRNLEAYLGFSDWRLPSLKELASIQERRCALPIFDVRAFAQASRGLHWTSTSSHYFPEGAFAMTMEFGHQITVPKTGTFAEVRLVRGGGPFDGYEGNPAYSVGGTLSGMVGGGLVLRLEPGEADPEYLLLDANGAFTFVTGLADGTSYTVAVDEPPTPFQDCAVTNGGGVINGADVVDVTVTCAAPPDAEIQIDPGSFAFVLEPGGGDSGSLAITNAGGGILDWSIQTAYGLAGAAPAPAGRARAIGGIDCEATPGLIVHDDGSVESAYTGNVNWPAGVRIVDKFTPESYPASIAAVCLAFAGNPGGTTLEFDLVVYDDNGPGGEPGTELGALPVTATGIPPWPVTTPTWHAYDISSLYTTIESGSVFVGLRWHPVNPVVFVLADESGDRPVGFAGGQYWNRGQSGAWSPTEEGFPNYRSQFIRAVEAGPQEQPTGCDDPHNVPWLEVAPTSGGTFAGQTDEVTVTVAAHDLAPGTYEALLCIASSDPQAPLTEVPVSLIVAGGPPILHLHPSPLEIVAPAGGSGTATLGVGNIGGSPLTWSLLETPAGIRIDDYLAAARGARRPVATAAAAAGVPACNAAVDIPWLSISPESGVTAPGDSEPVSVTVDASGLAPGDYVREICVGSNDPAVMLRGLPVQITVAASEPHFCDDVTAIPQSECRALVAIWETNGGADWGLPGWLSDLDPCTWGSVFCEQRDGAQHVIRLSFSFLPFTGSLAPEVAQLSYLETLQIQFTLLGGLPETIGNLARLEWLAIEYGAVSSIPASVGQLAQLKRLDLSGNPIGSLPETIGQLGQLEHLQAVAATLTGLPETIGNLVNLRSLYAQSNQIAAIPAGFGGLAALEDLDLSNNPLPGPMPAVIGNLSNLRRLVMVSNGLTGLPTTLGDLASLEVLDVTFNEIPSLPASLADLDELHILRFEGNLVTELPSWVGELPALRELSFGDNQIATLPASLASLTQLEVFEAAGNQLTGPVPSWLGTFPDLYVLKLADNQLAGEVPVGLRDGTSLGHEFTTLTLSGNGCLTSTVDPTFTAWLDEWAPGWGDGCSPRGPGAAATAVPGLRSR